MKKFFNWLGRFIIWAMAFVAFIDTIQTWGAPNWLMAVLHLMGIAAWWMWYCTED